MIKEIFTCRGCLCLPGSLVHPDFGHIKAIISGFLLISFTVPHALYMETKMVYPLNRCNIGRKGGNSFLIKAPLWCNIRSDRCPVRIAVTGIFDIKFIRKTTGRFTFSVIDKGSCRIITLSGINGLCGNILIDYDLHTGNGFCLPDILLTGQSVALSIQVSYGFPFP